MNTTTIHVPFTILVDGQEQAAWTFDGMKADANQGGRPLEVRTEWAHLPTGDYTIKGMEELITIERKSLADLFGSLGGDHGREKRKHERMSHFRFAAMVIEADWSTIINNPPERSKVDPKVIFRTGLSWSIRYGVHWWAMPGRRAAEITAFRLLSRFYQLETAKRKHEMKVTV